MPDDDDHQAGENKINICQINEMITCKICSGYLVDATTVTECLHTFCKSCIVKHLEDNINCPECEVMIHQSHPLDYIAFDRTMQDIVYKLVPSLEKDEYRRERDFYAERGMPCPKDLEEEASPEGEAKEAKAETTPEPGSTMDFHRFDEQVNLVLKSADPKLLPELDRKFVRVSSLATITNLKRFLAVRVLEGCTKDDEDRFRDIDITCEGELIPKDHTLKFVYVTRWRTKDPPPHLVYSPKIKLDSDTTLGSEARHEGDIPEWKLQPKLSYDDDEDDR